MSAADRRLAGRNVAYVFVDFEGGAEPSVFVLRGALVASLLDIDPEWPRDARAFESLEACRDAWHLLGPSGGSAVRSSSVVSSSPAP